jgi:tetratricopeptide (TPR) repeat protein
VTLETSLRWSIAPGEVFYWLGTVYQEEGDSLKGLEFLERSVPHYTTEMTYYQLIRVNLQLAQQAKTQGDMADFRRYLGEAERQIQTLLAMDPPPSLKPDTLYFQAYALLERGQLREARARLEDLQKQYPQGENILVALAQVYINQFLYDKARETLKQALQIIDQKLEDIRMQLASGVRVRVDVGARLRADRQKLEDLKAKVEDALRKLPP